MSAAALNVNAVSRPAVSPWLVATAVVIPTFMEILDTTIATASMRYIAGGLSATMTDSDWVMTSYPLAAKRHHPADHRLAPRPAWAVAGTSSCPSRSSPLASVLCGLATSLEQLILFRVIQGIAGGGLQPASQAILIDGFPPEKPGHGHDGLRHCRADRPGRRPVAGRLHHGQLQLAAHRIFLINLPIGLIRGYLRCATSRSATPNIWSGSGRNCGGGRSTSTTSAWDCSP